MSIIRRVFDSKGAPLLVAGFVLLFVAERRRSLRRRTRPASERAIINAIVSVPAFTLLRFLFIPVMMQVARHNWRRRFGLNYAYNAPTLVKTLVAFLVMDYTNYLWHVLNHKLPLLWRFHLVHHSDHDLDVTTALRFHFGEMIGSVFYRGAFVLLAGASAMQVLLYEILFEGATQFHHSNWRLPVPLEKGLNKIIVTPRMHGIHHSIKKYEADSNYSVIFSFWDRLHNSLQLNVAQEDVVIGVPAYNDPHELTISYLLKMPFSHVRQWDAAPAQI
jgi:sterol desaturase/sphingolipid hydroxylase (fatty acid hydroxylase superfamily)